MVDGYLNNSAANEASFRDGWFRTGDVGTISRDGYLTLVGRIKEMINRGGEKIAPREIDEVLLSHPVVCEAVAYGVADRKYGEVVHAVVVADSDVGEKELMAHCSQRLASFKVPIRIVLVDEIPKGPTGKVQRTALARKACRDEDRGSRSRRDRRVRRCDACARRYRRAPDRPWRALRGDAESWGPGDHRR